MKTFIYVINKLRNDNNGNPRRTMRVYDATYINDIKAEYRYPKLLIDGYKVGHRDDEQAVIEELVKLGYLQDRRNHQDILLTAMEYFDQGTANIVSVGF